MVYELMLQMGPIHNLHMPRDRVTQTHQGFGFVEFRTPADAEYASNVMNGVKMFGKPLRVNKASADKQRTTDVGAELFVGNLDAMADEKLLYDTFSRFGALLAPPKVAREDSGASKGFGFISYADFESSDAAIGALNGQYMLSREISVQYAFKKDGKGERHGDEAERALAAEGKKRNIVPEAQTIPQAFLSNGPPPATNSAPPPAAAGFAPPPSLGGHMPPTNGAPPGFAPPARGPQTYNQTGQPPPPLAMGRGSAPLAPPPSGLPARPPQGQPGYNPADYHPGGFRPPPTGAQLPPPPGFPSAPPGFAPNAGPPGAMPGAPPGFMPPPAGFQAPGYQRR